MVSYRKIWVYGVEIFNSYSGVGIELFWIGVELNSQCEAGVGILVAVELLGVGVELNSFILSQPY